MNFITELYEKFVIFTYFVSMCCLIFYIIITCIVLSIRNSFESKNKKQPSESPISLSRLPKNPKLHISYEDFDKDFDNIEKQFEKYSVII